VKVCIPIEERAEGGMFTFLAMFKTFLASAGVEVTATLHDTYDVLFVNSWAVDARMVEAVKRARPSIRVVQRVDGSARDYGRGGDADARQARVNLYADLTIFQSEYSRFSVREKFHVVSQDGPVIYNPVDTDRFHPAGPVVELPPGRIRVAAAAWSMNRMKGTWAIDPLAADNPDVQFVLCGRFDMVTDRANVSRLGCLDRDGMAAALRSCDLFLNLSENDPCPNVVLEAMASGRPVVYKPSGGVPELVGDTGVAIAGDDCAAAIETAFAARAACGAAARARALEHFAAPIIFPQYLAAIAAATPRPMPPRWGRLRLAARGYPVLPSLRDVAKAAVARREPRVRIGWITSDSLPGRKRRFEDLEEVNAMRAGNIGRWINARHPDVRNEVYRSGRRYDIVVFQKMMNADCRAEAAAIRQRGGRVVFDANVNYYHVWGDYFVAGTQPTDEQRRDAIAMTQLADWVVADSTYLESIIREINPRVTCVPDNVDLSVFGATRRHAPANPVRLVWSGVAKKAAHLLELREVLSAIDGIELAIVSDQEPDCLAELRRAVPCRVVRYSNKVYAETLRTCDIIISPKRLVNGYEMGHSEYKITLGMAAGLPAIASSQQSYVEALSHLGGGILASSPAEWRAAIERLAGDVDLRTTMGRLAHETVRRHYSTDVVAPRYLQVLATVCPALERAAAAAPLPHTERRVN
jgi:glycosyltransferase involved in cell wall biosynthesis